jgi:DhnA family fructose-bisphosphate aldolase class Ia
MQKPIGKAIRLSDILAGESLLLDTTLASSTGASPALENLAGVLQHANRRFDGIIVNPGQLEHLPSELAGKNRAAPLVRVDWTNAYRDRDFCLPVQTVKRVEISTAEDVMNLGGSAAVATLLMGFGDEFEAENIRSISHLLRSAYQLSLPVFVDIRPIGPAVSEINFEDAIKLGVSFMMEAGADALIVPVCSAETLNLIGNWSTVPVIVRSDALISRAVCQGFFKSKMAGILFSEKILETQDYLQQVDALKTGMRQ